MPTYRAVTPFAAYDGFTDRGEFNFVDASQLSVLDGLTYTEENIVEYMDEPLRALVAGWSGIRLAIDKLSESLTAVSIFECPHELSEAELGQLKDYYDAQMSDGIGENFLSEIAGRNDVHFELAVFWLYDRSQSSTLELMN